MDGLSVGVEVDDSRQEKDYLLVTAATLKEVISCRDQRRFQAPLC
jgi:hypothetical protein